MLTKEELIEFNRFRQLCLINAEDSLKSAEMLRNKSVNHIAFQLAVFCLEEVGKIFVGWHKFNVKEEWGKESYNIPIDDHVKKLFWAIWGPTFMNEKFTSDQMDEIKSMASNLHNMRLQVMYTELNDTTPLSSKISDQSLNMYLKMARARLEMAKLEGEVDTNTNEDVQESILWFMNASDKPQNRNFIFGHTSQEKLIELGNIHHWISWLKGQFLNEENQLKNILKSEIENGRKTKTESPEPKWKITLKIISKSHSIRQNILDKFNLKSKAVKFKKGTDSHTLLIDLILDKSVPITELWDAGWNTSNLFIAALNVGTNGLFYWNIPVNADKFYEGIWDLENNKRLDATLQTNLEIDWKSKHLYFSEEEIALSIFIFRFFSKTSTSEDFEPIIHYSNALGMLAKNDMHLRMEPEIYLNFYLAFKKAIVLNENVDKNENIKELGFKLIGNLLNSREEYNKVIEIGQKLDTNQKVELFSLTEIIGMKQYAGFYFTTLAARKKYGNNSLIIKNDK